MRSNPVLRLTFCVLTLALFLGLTACSGKSPSPVPDTKANASSSLADDGADSLGMTLEQAQEYSQSHDKLFLHRSDGRFYPLPVAANRTNSNRWNERYNAVLLDNISFYEAYLYGTNSLTDEITGSSTFADSELVYISLDSLPDTLDLIPVSYTAFTLPITFRKHEIEASGYQQAEAYPTRTIEALGGRHFADYNSSYTAISLSSESLLTSDLGISNLTINDLPLQDYCDRNQMLPVYVSNHYGDISTDSIVDLSDFTTYDPDQLQNGQLVLSEETEQNTAVIGYYEGTQYHSITLRADCLASFFDASNAISCPVTPTKDGYAIVDISGLPSGSPVEYFVTAYAPDDTAFSVIGILS